MYSTEKSRIKKSSEKTPWSCYILLHAIAGRISHFTTCRQHDGKSDLK